MMEAFLAGTIFAASTISALFFLKYWRATRDALFLAFAIAFTAQGIGQFAITVLADHATVAPTVYGAPLLGYVAVLVVVATRRPASASGKARSQS